MLILYHLSKPLLTSHKSTSLKMLSASVTSVPTMARFCNSSSTPVSGFLSSSPSLRLHSSNNLLPTLALTTENHFGGGVSSFHASNICRYSSSSSSSPSVWKSESAQAETSPFRFDHEAIHSLVQILDFCIEPFKPWKKNGTKKNKGRACGIGFVISGRRILTDKYTLPTDNSCLRVRKYGSPTFYTPKLVQPVVDEHGFAILVVDSQEFWENIQPLEIGDDDDRPSIGDTVSVFGPDHDTIRLKEMTVTSFKPKHHGCPTLTLRSDTDHKWYHDYCSPVVMGKKIVGSYSGPAGDIGITPPSWINNFLDSIEGKSNGLCSLDISWQSMKDAQLRRHFKMSRDMTGVLITVIDPLSNALKILKEHDVLLAIEGLPVSNDGKVHFQKEKWVHFPGLFYRKRPGETVLVKILRDGKEHVFDVSLDFNKHQLVPENYLASYYILAGFVFMPVSKPCVEETGDICHCTLYRKATKAGEQVVFISEVLSDDMNTAYSDLQACEVLKVNGVKVVNLKHLRELIEKCCTEDLRFDLEEGHVIVLNNLSAKEATSLILERHKIPSAMSNDLQETNSG